MFGQVKIYLYGAIALIIITLSTTVYIQRARISVLNSNVDKCIEANKASTETIDALKIERTKANKSCEAQMEGYNATLEWLRRIDGYTGGNYVQDGEGVIVSNSGDDLLDALRMLFPVSGGDKDGVCKAGSPGNAKSTDVLPGEISYCFCSEQDVKNLLKDLVLKSGRESALVTIVEGQRLTAEKQ